MKLLKQFCVSFILILSCSPIFAQPVVFKDSYAGNINFVGIDSTRRTESNAGNSCAILDANTTNTAVLTGIPTVAGVTIKSALLYWAGSYSTQAGSTRTTPDYTVNFEGRNVAAPVGRRYTANYTVGGVSVDYYSGVADVTSQVNAKRNGIYSFSGLSVNNGATTDHCVRAAVVAGWSLVVIYEAPPLVEDFRVINLYEGFQTFRGTSITITSNNFQVPSTINGKHATLTWEGDAENSLPLGGVSENLMFSANPGPAPAGALVDANNLVGAQFNSNSNIASIAPSTGAVNSNSYGVDFDSYDINSLLNAGDTSATTVYSSGADLVLLSFEILSVTNTEVSDLGILKTATSTFISGNNATYNLAVNNAGPNIEPGPITVTDSLPAGLTFVSATGTDWSCSSTAPLVTCTRTKSLADGASAPPITLTVAVSGSASSVTNTANVSGTNFDNQSANDSSTINTPIVSGPNITLQKTVTTIYDPVNKGTNPKAIPGSVLEYTITGINSGSGPADPNSISISDLIPTNTQLCVDDTTVDSFSFCIVPYLAPPNTSTLGLGSLTYFNTADVAISALPADADGTNSDIVRMSAAMTGSFIASSSFSLIFRVVVQ